MGDGRFCGHDAGEPVPQLSFLFRQKRCPHLLKTIVETGFENRASDSGKSGLRSEIDAKPTLICGTLAAPQRLRLFGAEADSCFGPEELNIPSIRFRWSHSLCFDSHWHLGSIKHYCSVQDCIVPSIADRHSSVAIWPFVYDLLQLSVHSHRLPTESKRNMDCMHTEISHYSNFSTGLQLAFPVDRFRRIQIAAVMEPDPNFQRLPVTLFLNKLNHFLSSRHKWEFGTAPHESFGVRDCSVNLLSRGKIDTERFFGQKIFSRFDNLQINLLMKLMRDSGVDYVDFRICDQFSGRGGNLSDGRYPSKPLARLLGKICHRNQPCFDWRVDKHEPAS